MILQTEFGGIIQTGGGQDVDRWGARLGMGSSRPHNYARISGALISSGCLTLDQQAKALGLGRSTAWNIIKNKHKLGRLSAKTIERILTNPKTPPTVRAVVQQYVAERSVSNRRKQNKGRFLLKDR